jgi:hypothetical protein
MATFLDRTPYIWLWRPTYRVFGSWIRECKAWITRADRIEAQFETRCAKIEAMQREMSGLLEQVLVTMLGDRQVPRAIEEMQALLASELSKHAAETSAASAAERISIEQFMLVHTGNSNGSHLAGNNHHPALLESAPRADKIG